MKNLVPSMVPSNWTRHLKILLAVAALTLGGITIDVAQVSAQSRSPRAKRYIQQLRESKQRWIQVDLSQQRLVAWEGKTPILRFRVSTGKRATPTPTGIYRVQTKLRKTRMQGPGYNMANVPHTMYYDRDFGIHGAYWHNRFGTPVSRGCVNLRPENAKRLYSWANVGTSVVIHK
jgi:lipoprotein-anchoring transpeptidase ErfK/SrfK